jgi:hypothetical protein
MSRVLLTSGPGFFSRLANFRLLVGVREAVTMEENPARASEKPAAMDVREVHTVTLDAVAGSEFVDDRIRLGE